MVSIFLGLLVLSLYCAPCFVAELPGSLSPFFLSIHGSGLFLVAFSGRVFALFVSVLLSCLLFFPWVVFAYLPFLWWHFLLGLSFAVLFFCPLFLFLVQFFFPISFVGLQFPYHYAIFCLFYGYIVLGFSFLFLGFKPELVVSFYALFFVWFLGNWCSLSVVLRFFFSHWFSPVLFLVYIGSTLFSVRYFCGCSFSSSWSLMVLSYWCLVGSLLYLAVGYFMTLIEGGNFFPYLALSFVVGGRSQ